MSTDDAPGRLPYEPREIAVLDSTISYIDEGEGEPILFLHGNPTSSYLWRNIIPHLTPHARCIAPDLIGMGRSGKPDIPYRFLDHYRYLEAFLAELRLTNLTLVLHDWGSGLGFHYASRHEDTVKALAFMEAIVKPLSWSDVPRDFSLGFRLFRTPVIGWLLLCGLNVFVTQILPKAVVRQLTEEEKAAYAAPFPTVASRKPVRMWPLEIPFDGKPEDMFRIVREYSSWLQATDKPKLLLYAHPGGIIRAQEVRWCRNSLPALELVDVGAGVHFVQEDNPEGIGVALAAWYDQLPR